MAQELTWDEAKRRANLRKHGLDFADSDEVLESRYRMDVITVRGQEIRTESYAYVMRRLRVLLLVHLPRDGTTRIVSFRNASQTESEVFYEWIGEEAN